MTRLLTSSEAIDLIEITFETEIDSYCTTRIEAFVGDIDTGRAKQDIDSYLSIISIDVAPDSIQVFPDTTEPPTVDCVRIVIKTEG